MFMWHVAHLKVNSDLYVFFYSCIFSYLFFPSRYLWVSFAFKQPFVTLWQCDSEQSKLPSCHAGTPVWRNKLATFCHAFRWRPCMNVTLARSVWHFTLAPCVTCYTGVPVLHVTPVFLCYIQCCDAVTVYDRRLDCSYFVTTAWIFTARIVQLIILHPLA